MRKWEEVEMDLEFSLIERTGNMMMIDGRLGIIPFAIDVWDNGEVKLRGKMTDEMSKYVGQIIKAAKREHGE